MQADIIQLDLHSMPVRMPGFSIPLEVIMYCIYNGATEYALYKVEIQF